MSKTLNKKQQLDESSYEILVAEEELILHAQMLVQRVLNEREMSQKQLAHRLGVGESYVSQMLGASARNLTLRTIARVLKALDAKAIITLDERVEEIIATDCLDTHHGGSEAAAVASKVASSSYSDVWDNVVVDISPRGKSRRSKGSVAQAYSEYDPQLQEMALLAA